MTILRHNPAKPVYDVSAGVSSGDDVIIETNEFIWGLARDLIEHYGHNPANYATAYSVDGYTIPDDGEMDSISALVDEFLGVENVVSHAHDIWQSQDATRWAELKGPGGSQTIPHNTPTIVALDRVTRGNANFLHSGFPNRFGGVPGRLYLMIGQVLITSDDVIGPWLYLTGPGGILASQRWRNLTVLQNTLMQAVGVFYVLENGQGVEMTFYHVSGSDKTIQRTGATWLIGIELGVNWSGSEAPPEA